MITENLRDLIFHTRGTKEGLMSAKIYIENIPMNQLMQKLQEHIDSCEDTEIRLSVELQKTSSPPDSLL
jgi:hypothetical protein